MKKPCKCIKRTENQAPLWTIESEITRLETAYAKVFDFVAFAADSSKDPVFAALGEIQLAMISIPFALDDISGSEDYTERARVRRENNRIQKSEVQS